MLNKYLQFAIVALSLQVTAPFAGYLFAYFEGRGPKETQEQLRFALSEDAVNWYALNDNRPVIASDSISVSGGIRDPHILRGEDGAFYIVATDMMVARNGWRDNPGIVLLRSDDLLNWTHATVHLSKDWSEHFSDAYWVWAPQTIYDRKAGKYMIYFTLQRSDRKSLITYYAYANADFTGFESEPQILFQARYGSIDNDIVEGPDGRYHLFYKGNTKDAAGKELGTVEIQSEIVSLTASEAEVLVLCPDSVSLFSSSLTEKGRLIGLTGFKYGLLRSRGEALLISSNFAEVYTF